MERGGDQVWKEHAPGQSATTSAWNQPVPNDQPQQGCRDLRAAPAAAYRRSLTPAAAGLARGAAAPAHHASNPQVTAAPAQAAERARPACSSTPPPSRAGATRVLFRATTPGTLPPGASYRGAVADSCAAREPRKLARVEQGDKPAQRLGEANPDARAPPLWASEHNLVGCHRDRSHIGIAGENRVQEDSDGTVTAMTQRSAYAAFLQVRRHLRRVFPKAAKSSRVLSRSTRREHAPSLILSSHCPSLAASSAGPGMGSRPARRVATCEPMNFHMMPRRAGGSRAEGPCLTWPADSHVPSAAADCPRISPRPFWLPENFVGSFTADPDTLTPAQCVNSVAR